MTLRDLAITFALAAGAGCNGAHDEGGMGGAGDGARATGASSSTCEWPASLDESGAAPGACRAAQHLLECELPDGAHGVCLSDTDQCPDFGADVTCHDRCATDEYAVSCGAIGPASSAAEPPSGCGSPQRTPGGPALYCCPCS